MLPISLSSAIFLRLVRRSASTLADPAVGGGVRFNAVTGLVANGVFVRTGHDDSHTNQRRLRAHAVLYVAVQSGRLWGIVGRCTEGGGDGVGCVWGCPLPDLYGQLAALGPLSKPAARACVTDNLTRLLIFLA